MPTSLFVEHHDDGLAFYLNGDLQFDTTDEALYHEYLVVPALALAVQRFPQTELRVLICGGGDGLAARDVLRFPQVDLVDLVDYNPEVLELGRTVFQPYNQSSLTDDRVTVHCQNAIEFVASRPPQSYHVILCDFTYPTCAADADIYTRDWFESLNSVLYPGGLVSTNGVSPNNRPLGFWCLYQTLFAAGFVPRPLQLAIPSFQRHGYGNWGFLLNATEPITQAELEGAWYPESLQQLALTNLLQSFCFPAPIANLRHQARIHTLEHPQLFYYLLNPGPLPTPAAGEPDAEQINFLDLQEEGLAQMGDNPLALETTAKLWLEQLYQIDPDSSQPPDLAQLLPVQHRYHTPRMTTEWTAHIRRLLTEIDPSKLLSSLMARSSELPPKVADNLKQLSEHLKAGTLDRLPPVNPELIMLLTMTLLIANLVTPDAVFAKGFYSGSSRSNDGYYYSSGGSGSGSDLKFWGLMMTIVGGFWLSDLFKNRPPE